MQKLPDDIGARIKGIIDKAVADIEALGADHANACALLGVQAVVRLDGDIEAELAAIKSIRDFADENWRVFGLGEGETFN